MSNALDVIGESADPGNLTELHLVDPIEAVLDEESREEYLSISAEIRKGLVAGLGRTKRWANHLTADAGEEEIAGVRSLGKGVRFISPDFQENNLDHVRELLIWWSEIAEKYPELMLEVGDGDPENWKNLGKMLIIHDIGEIVTGDLSRSDPDFHQANGRRHKRAEAKAAHFLLDRHLSPDQAAGLQALYKRFEARHPQDKLVMLGHALDKGQASQNVALHVIPFNKDNPDYVLDKHFDDSQGITLEYAEKLAASLKGRVARLSLRELMMEKVVRYFDDLDMPHANLYRMQVRSKFPRVFSL